MNIKTISSIAALVISFSAVAIASPSIANACTPSQASSTSWESRSTNVYQVVNGPFVDDTLYLSNPSWDATYFLPNTAPSYQGHLISDPLWGSAMYTGASWVATNNFFVRVDHVEGANVPGNVENIRAQVGYINPTTCSVHEGVDLFLNTSVNGQLSVSQRGLVNVSQGAAPARPAAGTNVALTGCWDLTTDFPNNSTIDVDTKRYRFNADGSVQGVGNAYDNPVYAAVENASNEIMFVMVYPSGTVVGGELTHAGNGQLEVDPADGILFSPYPAFTEIDMLPAGYMSGAPDPRQGTFEMHYASPTC